jgi:hypothetical protein
MPDGYDRMLTFTDDGMGMLGLVVATDADLASYAFASIDFEGRAYPAAVIGLATCAQYVEIESGALSATTTDDNRMTGTLDVIVAGAARTITLDVAIIQ